MNVERPEIEEIRPALGPIPRVSVIIPTFKARTTLAAAVNSVIAQTWRDFEIVVVDDACPDDSTDTLKEIDDHRLRIIRHARNVGVSGARNAGISVARSQLIAFLDADDLCAPHRLERQIPVLAARPDVGLVASWANRIDESGRLVARGYDSWRISDRALRPLLLFANPLTTSTFLFRRSAVPEHGFRPIFAEDYGFVHDVMSGGYDIVLVREALVDYRLSSGGIMAGRLRSVADGAMSVQRRALTKVGVPESAYDEEIMQTLLYFGAPSRPAASVHLLERLHRFLSDVVAANMETHVYNIDGLAEAADRMWEMLLHETARRRQLRLGPRAISLLLKRFSANVSDLRMRALFHCIANLVRKGPASPIQ